MQAFSCQAPEVGVGLNAEDVDQEPAPLTEEVPIPAFTDAPDTTDEPDAETARRPFYYPVIESPVRR